MADVTRAVLLDANLLLLVAVGLFDEALVGRKRLDIFTSDDLALLVELMSPYPRNLTMPHLLAEVSNLADQCVPKPRHRQFRNYLAGFVKQLDEQWAAATLLCQTDAFKRLGLADAAVCDLADERTRVIIVDAELCGVLWGRGVDAQNFNHLHDP